MKSFKAPTIYVEPGTRPISGDVNNGGTFLAVLQAEWCHESMRADYSVETRKDRSKNRCSCGRYQTARCNARLWVRAPKRFECQAQFVPGALTRSILPYGSFNTSIIQTQITKNTMCEHGFDGPRFGPKQHLARRLCYCRCRSRMWATNEIKVLLPDTARSI